ncbi:hypothetical protein KA005_04025 [bacterium]|nr:hypothetical protein [bacterium]
MRDKEHYEASKRLADAIGISDYHLDVFGDTIAKREGYKSVYGIEAIHFYLVHKFHWLPSQVKSMTKDDIRLVLSEEMHTWRMPKDALFPEDK